jgi:hypothetical protein
LLFSYCVVVRVLVCAYVATSHVALTVRLTECQNAWYEHMKFVRISTVESRFIPAQSSNCAFSNLQSGNLELETLPRYFDAALRNAVNGHCHGTQLR